MKAQTYLLKRLLVLILIILIGKASYSQIISPGEIAKAHKKWENDCTKCHELGAGLTNKKCLTCHKEVEKDVQNRRGYHGVRIEEKCWKCHSDHNGKDFPLVHFDKKKFNHKETDFILEGAHLKTPCEKCHIKAKYSETPSECGVCHKAKHSNKFGGKCVNCHSDLAWEEITYDHQKSNFELKGAHIKTKCIKCHTTNLNSFKRKVRYDDCKYCHRDVHRMQFANRLCKECHVEDSFKVLVNFDHNRAKFPLIGKHLKVSCSNCHKDNIFIGIAHNCQNCHKNPHRKLIGETCDSCHNNFAWKSEKFDHAKTGYLLEGKHISISCEKCHTKGINKALPHQCEGCHLSMPHPKDKSAYAVCSQCHTSKSWKILNYDHRASGYKLIGKHKVLFCDKCHTEKQALHNLNKQCKFCHKDIHQNNFGINCEICHNEKDWKLISFDHSKTKFILEFKHISLKCTQCHLLPEYRLLGVECKNCHNDVHKSVLGQNCQRCHTVQSWQIKSFDHARTKFPLKDKHSEIECKACHKNWQAKLDIKCRSCHKNPHDAQLELKCEDCHQPENLWTVLEYRHKEKYLFKFHNIQPCIKCHLQKKFLDLSANCINCHSDYHKGALGQDCYHCHRLASWKVNRFNHDESGFPLMGAHLALDCGDCHRDLITFRIVPRPNNCISCHEKDYRTAPFQHSVSGAGISCQECHLQDKWKFAHSPFWFNIQTGRHAGIFCKVCHKVPNNYLNYTCHECHSGHAGDNGGRCLDCHPSGFENEGKD